MKKMWPVFIVFCITLASLWAVSTAAIAMDQCDVVGNSYILILDGDDYVLSDFTSSPAGFSPAPRCHGYVTFISSNGRVKLEWYLRNGHLLIGGITAELTSNGLKIYNIPQNLHALRIGDTVYMTEKEIPQLLFE